MLNMNLAGQSLSAFTKIYDVSIAVFGHVCRSLHCIVSYSKESSMKTNASYIVRALTQRK